MNYVLHLSTIWIFVAHDMNAKLGESAGRASASRQRRITNLSRAIVLSKGETDTYMKIIRLKNKQSCVLVRT